MLQKLKSLNFLQFKKRLIMQEAKITFYPKNAKSVSINCEIAKSYRAKMKGMMNRESLLKDRGMLFSFLIPGHRFFWMKNVSKDGYGARGRGHGFESVAHQSFAG